MGIRKVTIRESAAYAIAEISWYLESEGLLATAENFQTMPLISFRYSVTPEKVTELAVTLNENLWDINAFLSGKNTLLYLLN